MKIRKNSIYAIFLILVMGLIGCANQKVNNNEKIEILGISVGEEIQVKDAIRNLLTAYEKEKEKNKELEKKLDEISEIHFPIIY